jgi:hypothetical protein
MVRYLAIFVLSLCVCAMPSYAAITCGSTCTLKSDTHDHHCCPDSAGQPSKHHHSQDDGKSSDDAKHHCVAPCCGYVAFVFAIYSDRGDAQPLTELAPIDSGLHDVSSHDAIFHPPRA